MYRDDYDKARAESFEGEDIYSKPVRAGKRTYFFDVKATRDSRDYYLTMLAEIIAYIKDNCFNGEIPQRPEGPADREDARVDLEFEDL